MEDRAQILCITIDEMPDADMLDVVIPAQCKAGHELSPSKVYIYRRYPNSKPRVRCKQCAIASSSDWSRHNPESVAASAARHAVKARARRAQESADARRDRNLRKHHGITLEQLKAILDRQNWKCPICSVHLTLALQLGADGNFKGHKNSAQVDHCHMTGVIRGALCLKCNMGLGYFNDSANAIQRAAEYVAKFQEGK